MKTPRSLFTLLAAALVSTAGLAHAQTVSPQPTPTIITTAPFIINAPGYYQLGANLFYAGNGSNNDAIITINSGNVTLDFAGHYISGPNNTPASTLYGVYAYERGNLLIQNGTVAFCEIGIYLNGSGHTGSLNINQTVRNMLVSYCYVCGIEFDYASNSAILNNRVSFIGGSTYAIGIYGFLGTGDKAVGNTITNVTAASGTGAYGIAGQAGTSLAALNNSVSNVTAGSGGGGIGIADTIFTVNNTILNCEYGVADGGKYMGNLTSGCTTPFSGGTAVGVNQ